MEAFDGRLPFVLNTIGEDVRREVISRDSGLTWNQFIWVKEGVGRFTVGEEPHVLGVGEGMFMRRGVPHSYGPDGDRMYTGWCTFFCSESLISYCIGDCTHIIFKVPDFLEKETAILTQLARSSSDLLEVSAAGYGYVTELFAAVTKPTDDVVGRVRDYLECNCESPITLDDVAAEVGLDRFALCRYFSKHHKRSVMEELKVIRIKKAKRLLRYSSYNIETIGRLCGYESPSYFALRFREECGCSPGEYRHGLIS